MNGYEQRLMQTIITELPRIRKALENINNNLEVKNGNVSDKAEGDDGIQYVQT